MEFENLEDRRMMAVVPVDPPGQVNVANSTLLSAAIQQAADLSQYSTADLAQIHNWIVGYGSGQSPAQMAASIGATSLGSTGVLQNAAIFAFPADVTAQQAASKLAGLTGATYSFPLAPPHLSLRSTTPTASDVPPNDPLFPEQWNLLNTGQTGGTAGADANVEPVWLDGDFGQNVIVGVIDSGVYHDHPDLLANYLPSLSYNFLEGTNDPTPPAPLPAEADHGTAVTGIIAATGDNGIGVSGAAPQAKFAGIRLIGGATITAQEIATALELHNQQIQIYNNSWGSTLSDSGIPTAASPLDLAALQDGAQHGRGGLGNIYVFAAGNGRQQQADANYDQLNSSRFAIDVTGVNDFGQQTTYGVPGASVLISGYTGNDYIGAQDTSGIATTDVIDDPNSLPNYPQLAPSYFQDDANGFNGTSAAAPLVSGVIALMLSANPKLSYRDVQMILAETATKNDPTNPAWTTNGASFTNDGMHFTPYHINNNYGFGAINAEAAVNLAKTWSPLPPENVLSSPLINVNQAIPDDNFSGVTSGVTFSGANLHVEHVEVTLNATHPIRGDLTVTLISPNGTQSVLAATRGTDFLLDANGNPVYNADYNNYTFTTVRDWGENSSGTWKLQVSDRNGNGVIGTFNSWQMSIYGTTDYAPIARDVSVNTSENTPVNISLAPNTYDYNTNGQAAASGLSIASQPLHGKVSIDPATGIVTYTPNFNFSGTDSFTYIVTDGQGVASRAATVTINVGFTAQAPTAVNDTASVALGGSAVIDVLANDFDPDAPFDPSTVTIVAQPSFGSVAVNPATGAVTYTPGGSFQLFDSFQYKVSDSLGATSNVATVTINRASAAPTATDDHVTTNKNQTTAIDILNNDVPGAPDVPIDPSTVSIISPPRFGSVHVDPTTGVAVYSPEANFFGQDSFTYTVSDIAHHLSGTANVTIVVLSSGAPLALDHEFVLAPGFPTIRGISALDNPTGSGSLIVKLVGQATLGTVALNPDGTFSYNQGPNFAGLDTFLYQVNDGVQDSNVGAIRLVSPQFHYVEQLYQTLLGRGGSDADILHWVSLMNGGANRNSIAQAFLNSAEYDGHLVNDIYQQLLGRSADFGGTSYWVAQMRAGLSTESVMAAVASSNEYYVNHGSTDIGFVGALYQDLLGRTPGQAEVDNWTTALNNGSSRANVAMSFLVSNEYRSKLINSYYQSYLGHQADLGGMNNWLFLFSLGYPRSTIQAGILASNEFYTL